MKALKIGALVMSALLLVMVLMMAYLFMTAEVTAQVVSSVGVSAAEQEGYFTALKTSVDEDTFIGTLYQKPTQWKDASEYVYLQFSVNVHNGCLVPIDMIEVQVVPEPTDIAQLGDLTVRSLGAKSQGDISATILVPKDSHTVRELVVTYYVWGVSFSLKEIYSGS